MGINYRGQNGELRGCINDVKHMARILTQKYHIPKSNVVLLTDDTRDKPTKKNILQGEQSSPMAGVALQSPAVACRHALARQGCTRGRPALYALLWTRHAGVAHTTLLCFRALSKCGHALRRYLTMILTRTSMTR